PFDRLFQRHFFRLYVLGNGRVDLALIDVGTIATSANRDRSIIMLEGLDGRDGSGATPLEPTGGLLRDQIDSAVDTDGKDLFDIRQIGRFAVMQDERPIAAKTR